MEDERDGVRVGIVGLGFMGQIHAENVTEYGHEVAAGVDLSPEVREEFADRFGARTHEDSEAMYAAEDLDAVAISTPNRFHEPEALAALDRDLDVLCEKPLAHTLESAERIARAAEESDGFCTVNFHNRISPPVSMFKGYQEEGRFGEVTHVEANYVRRRGVPGRGSWFTSREAAGGGALIDIGVHAVDLALYLLGFPEIESVMGVTRSNFGASEDYVDPEDRFGEPDAEGFDVDDSVTALIRCEGATISLEVAWATTQPPINEYRVHGTEAGARFTRTGETLTVYETGHQGTDHFVESTMDGDLEYSGWEATDRLFVDRVATGEAPALNTVDQALSVQRVLEAIYRSNERGESVSVADLARE